MTDLAVDDPAAWDASMDAVRAAPENHKVLYEDDFVRVISVSVPPGTQEKPHHHRWPSVFVIDRMVKLEDYDGRTGQRIPLPVPELFEPPLIAKMPPQPAHFVRNVDTAAFHGTRVEFKRGFVVSPG